LGASGHGKLGGIRAIYFYAARFETVLPMVAYAKNTQESLTDDQKKAVRKLTEGFERELEAERVSQA
jgi:hypothetical protein